MNELFMQLLIVAVVFGVVGFAAGATFQQWRDGRSKYAKMEAEYEEMKQRIRARREAA
jgi:spore cortex formation protein SpoVR/YcgB (stage V sporulation)